MQRIEKSRYILRCREGGGGVYSLATCNARVVAWVTTDTINAICTYRDFAKVRTQHLFSINYKNGLLFWSELLDSAAAPPPTQDRILTFLLIIYFHNETGNSIETAAGGFVLF